MKTVDVLMKAGTECFDDHSDVGQLQPGQHNPCTMMMMMMTSGFAERVINSPQMRYHSA